MRARVIATYMSRRSSSTPSRFVEAVLVREQAFLQPADEHGVELQAFGRMYRHQLQGLGAVGRLVLAGLERRMRQELIQQRQPRVRVVRLCSAADRSSIRRQPWTPPSD